MQMELLGLDYADIQIDTDGQPIASDNGDFSVVQDTECWLQDIRNEMLTAEGELFYEDQDDTESYGYSLVDFIHRQFNDDEMDEIRERFQGKLGKREDIDDGSIAINVEETEEKCNITVQFSKMDESQNYEMDIDLNEVEVVIDNG